MRIPDGAKVFIRNKNTGKFLFVLRENISNITNPGRWGLIGGGIKDGETPLEALEREVKEESNIEIHDIEYLMSRDIVQKLKGKDIPIVGHLFVANTHYDIDEIKVYEGEKAQYFTLDEIKREDLVPALKEIIDAYEGELKNHS